MTSKWETVSLDECVELATGFPFKSSEYSNDHDAVRLLRGDNIGQGTIRWDGVKKWPVNRTNGLAQYELRESDIVLAMDRPWIPAGLKFGRIRKSDLPALLVQRVARLRPTHRINGDYLFSVLSSSKFSEYIQNVTTGTAVPHISAKQIKSYHFQLPPIKIQEQIGQIHAILDDRITLLRETNKTLEAIAQALFKSWFVDFDPVRAKMEGRQPEGMDEATAALFPDSFEESELGLAPKGWQFLPFGQLLEHTIGGDWGAETPDDKNNIRVAIVRGTDIPDLKAGANLRVPIRYTSQKKLTPRAIQSGDIIIEVSGGSKEQPTGRSLYMSTELLHRFDCPVEAASFCRLLRPISKEMGIVLAQHMSYIYAQGKTWEYQNQSTGIANFQTTHFLEKELVTVPSQAILNLYSSIVAPLLQRTSLTQIQSLTDIRDTLLPRLISGQLRLPEAQEQIENALT